MKKRKDAFEIQNILIAYNFFMVALSFFMFYEVKSFKITPFKNALFFVLLIIVSNERLAF